MATWKIVSEIEQDIRNVALQKEGDNFRIEAVPGDEGFIASTDVPAPLAGGGNSTITVFQQYEDLKSDGTISADMQIGILSALGSSIADDLHRLFALNEKSDRIGGAGPAASPNYVYSNLGTAQERDELKKEVHSALRSLSKVSEVNDGARPSNNKGDRTFLTLGKREGDPVRSYESSYVDGAIIVACVEGVKAAKFKVLADSLPDDLLPKIDKVSMFSGTMGESNAKVLLCCGLLDGISQAISEEYKATADGKPLNIERIENLGQMLEKVTQKSLQVFGEYNAVREGHKDAERIRNQLVADFKQCEEYMANKNAEVKPGRESALKNLADKCSREGIGKAAMGQLLVDGYNNLDPKERNFRHYIIKTDPEIGICDPKLVSQEMERGSFVSNIVAEIANIKTVAAVVLNQLGKFTSKIKELGRGKEAVVAGKVNDTWKDRTGNSVDSQQDSNPANSKW